MIAVAEEGARQLLARMARWAELATRDPPDAFRAMGVEYVTFAVDHPGHFRAMHMPEYGSETTLRTFKTSRSVAAALLREGQRRGTVRAGDVDQMVMAGHVFAYGIARMFVDGLFEADGITRDQAKSIAEMLIDVVASGLRTRGVSTD